MVNNILVGNYTAEIGIKLIEDTDNKLLTKNENRKQCKKFFKLIRSNINQDCLKTCKFNKNDV